MKTKKLRKKKKSVAVKIALTMLAVVLLIGGTIGGTLAWLAAESGPVTNTFTVGKIEIELKEHELKNDGTLDTSKEVVKNENYKILPGATQPKDPFVTVKANSENCYVYVLVTNDLVIGTDPVAVCDIYANWEQIGKKENSILYRHNAIVNASESDQSLQVFSKVTYDGEKITKATITGLNGKTIEIKAYAHQADNLTEENTDAANKAVADAAARAHFGFTATP